MMHQDHQKVPTFGGDSNQYQDQEQEHEEGEGVSMILDEEIDEDYEPTEEGKKIIIIILVGFIFCFRTKKLSNTLHFWEWIL